MSSLLSSPSTDAASESMDLDADSPARAISESSHSSFYDYSILITNIFILVVSSFGVVVNGTIIWVLGFTSKICPFTIYILNLATADLGVVTARIVCFFPFVLMREPVLLGSAYYQFFLFMCMASQFLLTAISLDRCVAFLFAAWRRSYQPGHLSIIVCVLLWIFSFLLSAVHFIRFSLGGGENISLALYPFKVTVLICLPLWFVSTGLLLVQVCCKTEQSPQQTLLTAILVTLIFSFLFVFPLNIIGLLASLEEIPVYVLELGSFGACLNSSVNPVIYYFVGRGKHGRSAEKIKITLQRVFQEREENQEDVEFELQLQSQL